MKGARNASNSSNFIPPKTIWETIRQIFPSSKFPSVRYSIINKESTSAIKVATMKNMDDFHYKEKPSCATVKSTPFAHLSVSKDECDTKEDTGKSMKNALYVRHMSG